MGWKGTMRSIAAAQRRAERESLRRQRELERQRKQLEKMQEIERAAYEVETFENYLEVITSVHKDCGDEWDWELLQSSTPPVEPRKMNKNESSARAALESYKPNIIDKMFNRQETIRAQFQ